MKTGIRWWGFALALGLAFARPASALSIKESNIVDLLKEADAIVVGKITAVTDGIDEKGIPYTEITLEVKENLRGGLGETYTFRQFGLLKPRPMPDGKRTMMPAPEGFPRYTIGETDVLFLHPVASWTGFRTTARLGYGKFAVRPGRVENEMGNAGLFRNVRLDKSLTNDAEKRMMAKEGAANPDSFLAFVRRAVNEHWVETGRMSREKDAR